MLALTLTWLAAAGGASTELKVMDIQIYTFDRKSGEGRAVNVGVSTDLGASWQWSQPSRDRFVMFGGGSDLWALDLTPALGYVGDDRRAVYGLGCIGHGVAMSYLNGVVLSELLLGDGEGVSSECPFVNRRVLRWPAEPLAGMAKQGLRAYLRVEDALHEHVLTRVPHGSRSR